jgi:hypothetical protein
LFLRARLGEISGCEILTGANAMARKRRTAPARKRSDLESYLEGDRKAARRLEGVDRKAARRRVERVVEQLRLPSSFASDAMRSQDSLIRFCSTTGESLDWILLGQWSARRISCSDAFFDDPDR